MLFVFNSKFERVFKLKQYSANRIKNIAIVGHGGKGKTSLCEAMLYVSGATDRLGKVSDGNTVMDFDPEEKKRAASVSAAVAPLEWKDCKLNIIDTPGMFDFAGGMCEGIRAAGTCVIVISGKSGVAVGDEKAFAAAKKQGAAKFFFISKMNSDKANFDAALQSLIDRFGNTVCPIIVPLVENHKVIAYVNLLTGNRVTYENGKPVKVPGDLAPFEKYIEQINEAVAATDDELMEKYFNGEKFTQEELLKGVPAAIKAGELAPVYCGAGLTLEGVDLLLDGLVNYAPSALEKSNEPGKKGEETVQLTPDENAPAVAVVFKTVADPQVGKRSYFKVISGKITPDSQLVNARTGETERIGKLFFVKGAKAEEAPFVPAGDIGSVSKLSGVKTGDTLCAPGNIITARGVDFPAPSLSMCIKPKKRGDEEKIVSGLNRIMEEDPTVAQYTNHETHEQIVSGLGEQHLDVVCSKLKNKFGVDVELSVPRVAYRETIRKKVEVQGRHKKQSGGHGQFGDVWIRFEPCDSDELVFAEEVFGGSVPKNFFPAVEKGLRDSMKKGPLAGYPVVGIKATLYDGSYHPVDSSEMAFKTAASIAFKNAFESANPTLLEPIGMLKVTVPAESMGDVNGDITKRRGRPVGMDQDDAGMHLIEAEGPRAEMGSFSTVLRSATQGRGSFTLDFLRYDPAPPAVVEKVIAEAKAKGDIE